MEYVTGIDLREYLQSQPLTRALSMKLIELLITFKDIGLERIDHHKRQIYVQPDGSLKVIDVGRTVWRNRVYPYPRKLLNSLGEENRSVFLTHVQEMAPELYQEWQYYMHLEALARQAYQKLASDPTQAEAAAVGELCRSLLPESGHVPIQQIEALIYRVFKEESWKQSNENPHSNPQLLEAELSRQWEEMRQQLRAEVLQNIKEQIQQRKDELWNQQMALEEEERRSTRQSKRERIRAEIVKVRSERFAIRRLRKNLG